MRNDSAMQQDAEVCSDENFFKSGQDDSKKESDAVKPRGSVNSQMIEDDKSSRSSGRHYSYEDDDD